MSTEFTPGVTMSVRARRAMFEASGTKNNATSYNATSCRQNRRSSESTPDHYKNPNNSNIADMKCDLPSRRPLSFITPNAIRKCSQDIQTISMKLWSGEQQRDSENIAALKVELSDLQRQVKSLDEEVSHPGTYLGRSCNPSKENDQIAMTMKQLNNKLNEIQTGLLEIEDERESFSSKIKKLEQDKKLVENNLAQRDREIVSLSKRCNMQADISKNTSHLLFMNKELSKKIVDLEDDLRLRNEAKLNINELKEELDATKKSRDQLEKKVIDVTNDHEAMSEKLHSCLETCELLTLEKRNWENEYATKAEPEMLMNMNNSQEEAVLWFETKIHANSIKITSLEKELAQKNIRIEKFSSEMEEVRANHTVDLENITSNYESKIDEIRNENSEALDQVSTEYEEHLMKLESKLVEKEENIQTLQNDVAVYLEDLMSTSSALAEQKENASRFEKLAEDIEALHHELTLTKEEAHEKETNIHELSAEILKLELEKELLNDQVQSFIPIKEKMHRAIEEKESMRVSYEKQVNDARVEFMNLQKKIKETNDVHANLIRRARADNDDQFSIMENEIRSKEVVIRQQNEIVADNEAKIRSLYNQIEVIEKERETSRKRLEDEVKETRHKLQCSESEVHRITELNAGISMRMDSDNQTMVSSLQSEILRLETDHNEQRMANRNEIQLKDKLIAGLREQVLKISEDSLQRTEKVRSETSSLQKDLQNLKSKIMLKDDEIRELKVIELPERDETIVSLRRDIAQLEDRCKSSETDYNEQISNLENDIFFIETKKLDIERERSQDAKNHLQVEEKLQKTLEDTRRELEFTKMTISSLESKLEESCRGHSSLQDQMKTLEQIKNKALSDREEMLVENDNLKIQVLALRKAQDNERTLRDREDLAAFKHKCELLQAQLSISEKKATTQAEQMAALESTVVERTSTLSSIVDLNKQADLKLDATERMCNALEEKASNLQVELIECESQLSLYRTELRQKESEFLEILHEEQNKRETTEFDLNAMRDKLEYLQQIKKELKELKKENQDLKDKIQRQEGFMQRKLGLPSNKENTQRDRNVGSIPRNQTPLSRNSTPNPRGPLQSKLQRPPSRGRVSIPKEIGTFDMSNMTCSTADESESLDMQLSHLLGD